MSLLSVVRSDNDDVFSLKTSITKSLNLINFNFNSNIHNVIIKPNLCYYHDPSTGEVTDPIFISAIIDALREQISPEIKISIVESDASAMRCKYVFKMLGYEKIFKDKSVNLINLAEERSENITFHVNNKDYELLIPILFKESDLFINVPKIKYMSSVKLSCALKNIYGCNAHQKKSIYHKILNETIVELNKLIKTDLVIVDGLIVRGMSTRKLGLIMASEDPVAIDAAASKVAGIVPNSVKAIKFAEKKGIGNHNYIEVGENLQFFKELFPNRKNMDKIRKMLSSIYFSLFS